MATRSLTIKKIFTRTQLITLVFIIFAALNHAQNVDLNYDPSIGSRGDTSIPINGNVEIQNDGKIIVFSNSSFNTIAGVSIKDIARLNVDGTLDTTFNCDCSRFNDVINVKALPDGKILIAGRSTIFRPSINRLNPDGSRDTTFTDPFINGGISGVVASVEGIQSDGKIIAVTYGSQGSSNIATIQRLNANGTIDTTFTNITLSRNSAITVFYRLEVLADNKIIVAGLHKQFGQIFRLMPDGLIDDDFEAPLLSLANGQGFRLVRDFAFQSDGKLVINGNFDGLNGLPRTNFARLNADGTVDTSFSTAYTDRAFFELFSNDQIAIANDSSTFSILKKLNADGTLDNSFPQITNVKDFAIDNSDRIVLSQNYQVSTTLVHTIRRYENTGTIDNSFEQALIGRKGRIDSFGLQTDGKILTSGFFNIVDGVFRNDVARINPDGSNDETFDSPGVNRPIKTFAFQSDGKILIGGDFDRYGLVFRSGFARLNVDGSLDTSFEPFLNGISFTPSVSAIVVQSDGKILIGGRFVEVNGTSRVSVARINSDGSLDATFNPSLVNASIISIVLQSDGKIMLGGNFQGINGASRINMARLNADATLDTSFNAGNIGIVNQIFRRSDGDYLVNTNTDITLRNSNGSVDNSFDSPTINAGKKLLPLDDGTIIVAGSFSEVDGVNRNKIARVLADGSLDTSYFPVGVQDGFLNDIIQQDDGKIVIGGEFTGFENVVRSSMARFTPTPFIPTNPTTNFDFDGDGKADIAVFRPSENKWYVLRSTDFGVTQQVFAINGDSPVPADYDGDGITDFTIFRESLGDWWSLSSKAGNQVFSHLGQNGDIPRPSDFDGDGRADYVVYRPENSVWYRSSSSNGAISNKQFGISGDKPVVGDFDGDGRSDLAIYRPSTGVWWYQSSIDNSQKATGWGISTDIPAPGDYDGDGITDFAVYRPSTGVWYIFNSGTQQATIVGFGISEDKPVPADYDGDGKVDIAVYRPSTGTWYLLQSTAGFTALQFGISTDIPIPNALIP